jgi:riboflavin kinase/FMN adenylyltransferase
MRIIRGLNNLPNATDRAVTIGNFDGVHLGHQRIISHLVAKAKELNLTSTLMSFSPTPQQFFGKHTSTLSTFRHKQQSLVKLGLDEHLIINFNHKFSQLEATEFVQTILINQLNTKYCLIGDDFRFGAQRLGDLKLLKTFAFISEKTVSIKQQNLRVSSSNIRELLQNGKLDLAKQLLGDDFSITGKIIRGQQLGRTLNFPTINIAIKSGNSPILGVFAVKIALNNHIYTGVANIGTNPTVAGTGLLLEVFIFDFAQDVYGQRATIIFKHKIRDEQKFADLAALKQQIQRDVQAAKKYFSIT